jgi:hypothetical protein
MMAVSPSETTQAVEEIQTRGYTLLRGAMGTEWVAATLREFSNVLNDFASRTRPNRGPRRYYMNVPPLPPFLGPLAEPRTHAVLEAMLGAGFVVENLASDTPMGVGSEAQALHQDGVQSADIRLKLGKHAASCCAPRYCRAGHHCCPSLCVL